MYTGAQNPTIHIDGFCQHYTATAYFYVSRTRIPISFKTLLNRLSSPKKRKFIVASSPSPSSLSPTHPKLIRISLSNASIVGDKSDCEGLHQNEINLSPRFSSPHLTSNARSPGIFAPMPGEGRLKASLSCMGHGEQLDEACIWGVWQSPSHKPWEQEVLNWTFPLLIRNDEKKRSAEELKPSWALSSLSSELYFLMTGQIRTSATLLSTTNSVKVNLVNLSKWGVNPMLWLSES